VAGPAAGERLEIVPTGPATASTASTFFGRVLAVGSDAYSGCSMYLLTSDQLHALSGAAFACRDNANVLGQHCDTVLWPALLTNGAPIAGPGVNRRLLGTVTRTDLLGTPSAQQVTYAGQPLYRFFLDEVPGETEGANLDNPVTSPAGIWYLVDPRRGNPAPGQAQLQLETAPVGGTGPEQTVLAATMNSDFSVFPGATFPVYTLSRDRGHRWDDMRSDDRAREGSCEGVRAVSCPRFSPPGGLKPGPASTSMPSGSS
jgi:predicted lipoprotein with Yx(FWY)xxD motif